MSGAPVLDQLSDRVVGMVTSTWYSSSLSFKDHATSFAVPSEAILHACPDIKFAESLPEALPGDPPGVLHNLPRLRRAFSLHARQQESLREIYDGGAETILVSGPPGVGKTRLACAFAQDVVTAGQAGIVAWLPEYTLATTFNDVLDVLAGVIRQPDLRRLPVDEKEYWLCSNLAQTEALIIFDGLDRNIDGSVRLFIDRLPAKSRIVVTSRRDSIVDADERIVLERPGRPESLSFLRRSAVGKRLGEASEIELDRIYEITGGLPAALEWAVAQINSGRQTFDSVVEAFERGVDSISHRLYTSICDALASDEASVVGILAFLPEGARIDFLAACLEREPLATEQIMAHLIDGSVAESSQDMHRAKARYVISAPLRSFVHAGGTSKTAAMILGLRPLTSFYQEYINARSFMYKRNSDAYRELEDEYRNIESVIDECVARGMSKEVCELCLGMSYFYAISGRWNTRIARARSLLAMGRNELSPERRAWILINELGYMLITRGEWSAAQAAIAEGRELLEEQRAGVGIRTVGGKSLLRDDANVVFMRVLVLRYMGLVVAGLGDSKGGVGYLGDAIRKFLELHRRTVAANTRIELGETYLLAGEYDRSRQAFEEGLDYHLSQVGDKPWVNTWIARGNLGLGDLAFRARQLDLAKAYYEEASNRSKIVGSVDGLAMATRGRALIADAAGDAEQARDLATTAREAFMRIGRGEAVRVMTDLIVRCGDPYGE
jgi:tetratricopeptide (TPR) repeat protein